MNPKSKTQNLKGKGGAWVSKDLLATAGKCLRELRWLCQNIRPSRKVLDSQQVLNAMRVENAISLALEYDGQSRGDLGVVPDSNQISKPITVVIIVDGRNGKKDGAGANRARGVRSKSADV